LSASWRMEVIAAYKRAVRACGYYTRGTKAEPHSDNFEGLATVRTEIRIIFTWKHGDLQSTRRGSPQKARKKVRSPSASGSRSSSLKGLCQWRDDFVNGGARARSVQSGKNGNDCPILNIPRISRHGNPLDFYRDKWEIRGSNSAEEADRS
jgi:hypothetical protein